MSSRDLGVFAALTFGPVCKETESALGVLRPTSATRRRGRRSVIGSWRDGAHFDLLSVRPPSGRMLG
jgi:hypothetical protein